MVMCLLIPQRIRDNLSTVFSKQVKPYCFFVQTWFERSALFGRKEESAIDPVHRFNPLVKYFQSYSPEFHLNCVFYFIKIGLKIRKLRLCEHLIRYCLNLLVILKS